MKLMDDHMHTAESSSVIINERPKGWITEGRKEWRVSLWMETVWGREDAPTVFQRWINVTIKIKTLSLMTLSKNKYTPSIYHQCHIFTFATRGNVHNTCLYSSAQTSSTFFTLSFLLVIACSILTLKPSFWMMRAYFLDPSLASASV